MSTAHKFGDDSYYLVGDDKKLVFLECQLCHRQAAFFTNTGVTHCLGCSKAPGVAGRDVAVELQAVESSLNRAVVEYLDFPAKSADLPHPSSPHGVSAGSSLRGGK